LEEIESMEREIDIISMSWGFD